MQSFSFQVDHEIEKIITIERADEYLDISVRFATDVILEEIHERIPARGVIDVVPDRLGITLTYAATDEQREARRRRRY